MTFRGNLCIITGDWKQWLVHCEKEKTMTKTVVVKRKAKRAGNGVNRCEYLRNEHHFPVAVRNVLTE